MRKKWVLTMAWRDASRSRKSLLLLVITICTGISAMVSISSFRDSLHSAISDQAKPLLGADLEIASRSAFSKEVDTFLDSISKDHSKEVTFASMAYFPKSAGSRLVQVNALSGGFPYYGRLETVPTNASESYKSGEQALVDESLILQFDAEQGEIIRIGQQEFTIAGILKKVPGVVDARNAIAPRIYIRYRNLEKTGLLKRGSRARYKAFYKLSEEFDVDKYVLENKETLLELNLTAETISGRAEALAEVVDVIYYFLDLVGFIALVLGALGLASASTVYVRRKIRSISMLRCLGASSLESVMIVLAQILLFGSFSILLGVGIGILIQVWLPFVLQDFLPFDLEFSVSVPAVLFSVLTGLILLVLFSLEPLWRVRRISPLNGLRLQTEESNSSKLLRLGIWSLTALGTAVLAILQSGNLKVGAGFSVVILVGLSLLSITAVGIRVFSRSFLPKALSFPFKQGLLNLSRPNNQTLLLTVCIGMSAFLMIMIFFVQSAVLQKAILATSGKRPNTVLFDVQTDQLKEIKAFVESFDLPIIDEVPIVSMRLRSINGVSIAELRNDESNEIPDWTLKREYRSTYRGALLPSEELLSGELTPRVSPEDKVVPVSLEEGIAKRLRVEIGDVIEFDVQGVSIQTEVRSIRKVDWQQVQPNFFVVFPEGILEEAPQFLVIVTRAETKQISANFQRATVEKFPNVSVIDLTLVLSTLDAISSRLALVVRFMGFFSVLTAVIVLVTAVINVRAQRVLESVLLKTLGASRALILKITFAEYMFLGVFAAISGGLLATVCSWALALFVFQTPFAASATPIVLGTSIVLLTTLIIGLLGSHGTYSKPAIELLNAE